MRSGLRVWWPVFAWTVAIAAVTLPAPPGAVAPAPPGLDKLVHFVLYFGLGRSLGRALWLSRRIAPGAILAALGGGVGLAAANEWAQRLSPVRVPSTADWLADTAGVSLGLAVYLWSKLRLHRIDPSAESSRARVNAE